MERARGCFIILVLMLVVSAGIAQTKTIYLFRHAEKDTTGAAAGMMSSDPELSEAGKLRARKIAEIVKEDPEVFYTTNFKRTKFTLMPLATRIPEENQTIGWRMIAYDPRKQQLLADSLLTSTANIIVVVGHSNTIPALANLLIKQEKYAPWDESVYNKYFIVTIKDEKVEAKMLDY